MRSLWRKLRRTTLLVASGGLCLQATGGCSEEALQQALAEGTVGLLSAIFTNLINQFLNNLFNVPTSQFGSFTF